MEPENTQREAQLKAVAALKAKGVTAIKLELEAQLYRSRHDNTGSNSNDDDDDERQLCTNCDGDEYIDCPTCDSTETVTDPLTDEEVVCPDCLGGSITCTHCNGDGYEPEPERQAATTNDVEQLVPWGRERACLAWLMERIGQKVNQIPNFPYGEGEQKYLRNNSESKVNPFTWMKYAKFYNDGSVDSELTFTIKLDNPENIFYLPLVIEAWNEMAATMGAEMGVTGAGMHTALMWSPDYTYPHDSDDYQRNEDSDSNRLDETSLRNYQQAVTQLLPALYFLGTTNEVSRSLKYRMPYVNVNWRTTSGYEYWYHPTQGAIRERVPGGGAKYCAIVYRQGAMEFRLFDTCYDNPSAILDNVVVIGNTMKYLSPTYKSPGVDKKVGSEMTFGNDSSRELGRFYVQTNHLEALNIGLTILKPSYFTVKQLKKQRNFSRTLKHCKNRAAEIQADATVSYLEYKERFDMLFSVREQRNKAEYMEHVIREASADQLSTLTPTVLEERVAAYVEEWKQHEARREVARDKWIADRVKTLNRSDGGENVLKLA